MSQPGLGRVELCLRMGTSATFIKGKLSRREASQCLAPTEASRKCDIKLFATYYVTTTEIMIEWYILGEMIMVIS